MKALIVDDESHVVEAVQLLVPWEKYGITQTFVAYSVPEACDVLDTEQPEIAIVDVVISDMLGIEILKYIKTENLRTQTIVLSGHDDYRYTRAMFVLGAVDYLLKPIVPEEIEGAVRKAVDLVQPDTTATDPSFGVDRQLKHIFPDHQHSLFRKLFRSELREVAYRELCMVNAHVGESRRCCVLFCSGQFLPIYSQDYVIALSGFLDLLQNTLETNQVGTLFQRNEPTPDVVIFLYDGIEKTLQMIEKSCRTFSRETGKQMAMGSSGICAFPEEIDDAWKKAIQAYGQLPCSEEIVIRTYEPNMPNPSGNEYHKKEEDVLSALLINDQTRYDRAFALWWKAINSDIQQNRGGLSALYEHFLSLYRRACESMNCSTGGDEHTAFASFYTGLFASTVTRMMNYAKDRLWDLCLMQNRQKNDSWVEKVANYLTMNYGKKFSQQECADLFHLNKDYMCRHFREYYGVNMVAFLNDVRIRKAQELLRNSDMQIQEIAEKTGFFDVKYFSSQFKKATGQTPRGYRSNG